MQAEVGKTTFSIVDDFAAAGSATKNNPGTHFRPEQRPWAGLAAWLTNAGTKHEAGSKAASCMSNSRSNGAGGGDGGTAGLFSCLPVPKGVVSAGLAWQAEGENFGIDEGGTEGWLSTQYEQQLQQVMEESLKGGLRLEDELMAKAMAASLGSAGTPTDTTLLPPLPSFGTAGSLEEAQLQKALAESLPSTGRLSSSPFTPGEYSGDSVGLPRNAANQTGNKQSSEDAMLAAALEESRRNMEREEAKIAAQRQKDEDQMAWVLAQSLKDFEGSSSSADGFEYHAAIRDSPRSTDDILFTLPLRRQSDDHAEKKAVVSEQPTAPKVHKPTVSRALKGPPADEPISRASRTDTGLSGSSNGSSKMDAMRAARLRRFGM